MFFVSSTASITFINVTCKNTKDEILIQHFIISKQIAYLICLWPSVACNVTSAMFTLHVERFCTSHFQLALVCRDTLDEGVSCELNPSLTRTMVLSGS